MAIDVLKKPIQFLKGVGEVKGDLLKKELNIFTFGDLLTYFPFRYEDRSQFHTINQLLPDLAYIQLVGVIISLEIEGVRNTRRLKAIFADKTGRIELIWFQQVKRVKESLTIGKQYIVFGKPKEFNGKFSIIHPDMEDASMDNLKAGSPLVPIYYSTEKLKSFFLNAKGFSKLQRTLLDTVKSEIKENLTTTIISKYKFLSRSKSLELIHFPSTQKDIEMAQLRIKFEELFFIQLQLLSQKILKDRNKGGHVFNKIGHYFNSFYEKNLPFELTNAQKRVLKEIRKNIASGKQMNRLLQGDVGSGKTLVGLMSMLMALDNGFQSCLMAPTEILAIQHYKSISKFLLNLDVNVKLLTGSTKKKDRKVIFDGLLDGSVHIIIGTHALIEDNVQFNNLGLSIIDEQHRFGVAQRAKLWEKNNIQPHILVMTATPIPRTLAMTLYGDLDVSVIDELPPGRKPIKTMHLYESGRLRLFGFICKQIAEGHQVYIVYPLIKESEKLDLMNLEQGYEAISRAFPIDQYQISVVHGKMKSEDKDYEMKRFLNKETQIMVATTVIEVGVDIPNASLMVIENAERFGLSQLHQLRGRVGRGASQSYCILMTAEKLSSDARIRIKTMERTCDGFDIAEVDLKLRGPGDITGTQQSGILDLKLANLSKDGQIVQLARDTAMDILEQDPFLTKEINHPIAQHLSQIKNESLIWSKIS